MDRSSSCRGQIELLFIPSYILLIDRTLTEIHLGALREEEEDGLDNGQGNRECKTYASQLAFINNGHKQRGELDRRRERPEGISLQRRTRQSQVTHGGEE